MHYYAGNHENDTPSYLASALLFEDFVDTLEGTLRYVKAKRAASTTSTSRGTSGRYGTRATRAGNWTEAPHLAEESYNLEDALVVAQWLNVFLRKSHVLKIACVAQIVNVISWLHTKSDGLLKQPSYYVFKLVSNRRAAMRWMCWSRRPQVETKQYGAVPALDVSASYDPDTGNGRDLHRQPQPDRSRGNRLIWQDGRPDWSPGLAAGRHRPQASQHLG